MSLSDNRIMWDCIVDIFKNKCTNDTFNHVRDFIADYYENDGKEVNYNFSHDNWALVLCWLHIHNNLAKKLFPMIGHHMLHPLRAVRFLWMRFSLLQPLRIISLLDMIVRHGIIRRKASGEKYHTSGLLMDFYIHYSYKNKIELFILTKLMKTMFKDWDEVFSIYHNHPNQYNYKVYMVFLEENNGII